MAELEPDLTGMGENVAWISTGYADPPVAIVEGWLDSLGHRENIEGDWTHTGMGATQQSDDAWYATQLFGNMP